MRAIQIEIEGRVFSNISEAAKHYGLKPSTVNSRIHRGMSTRQAFDLDPPTEHKQYNRWLRRKGFEERVCSRCKKQKPLVQFYEKPDSATGTHSSQCRECVKKQVLESHRRRTYGLDTKAWNDLFESQGSCCAICGVKEIDHEWHTDHCHETGKVRGVLCKDCNFMLGFAKDNKETLKKAIGYLS